MLFHCNRSLGHNLHCTVCEMQSTQTHTQSLCMQRKSIVHDRYIILSPLPNNIKREKNLNDSAVRDIQWKNRKLKWFLVIISNEIQYCRIQIKWNSTKSLTLTVLWIRSCLWLTHSLVWSKIHFELLFEISSKNKSWRDLVDPFDAFQDKTTSKGRNLNVNDELWAMLDEMHHCNTENEEDDKVHSTVFASTLSYFLGICCKRCGCVEASSLQCLPKKKTARR